jgi:hypothetical protein
VSDEALELVAAEVFSAISIDPAFAEMPDESPAPIRGGRAGSPEEKKVAEPRAHSMGLPCEVAALFCAVRETVRSRLRAEGGRFSGDGEVFDAMLECALLAWSSSSAFASTPCPSSATALVTSKLRGSKPVRSHAHGERPEFPLKRATSRA